GRMDLLTVVTHEFGHILNLAPTETGVMEVTLTPGVRALPEAGSLGVTSATISTPRPADTTPALASVETHALPTVETPSLTPVLSLGSSSRTTVASPSTTGADLATAILTLQTDRMAPSTAILATQQRPSAIVLPDEGSTLQMAFQNG